MLTRRLPTGRGRRGSGAAGCWRPWAPRRPSRPRRPARSRASSASSPWATCTAPTISLSRSCKRPASSTRGCAGPADAPTSSSWATSSTAGADSRKALDLLRTAAEGGRPRRGRGAPPARQSRSHADARRPALRLARRVRGVRDVAVGRRARDGFLRPARSRRRATSFARRRRWAGRDEPGFGPEGQYGKWLRDLNAVVKINGMLFLHGGISPEVAALPCDDDQRDRAARDDRRSRADPRAPMGSLAARERRAVVVPRPGPGARRVRGPAGRDPGQAAGARDRDRPHGRARRPDLGRFGGKVFQIDTGMQPGYVPAGRASALEIQRRDVHRDLRGPTRGSRRACRADRRSGRRKKTKRDPWSGQLARAPRIPDRSLDRPFPAPDVDSLQTHAVHTGRSRRANLLPGYAIPMRVTICRGHASGTCETAKVLAGSELTSKPP